MWNAFIISRQGQMSKWGGGGDYEYGNEPSGSRHDDDNDDDDFLA